MINFQKRAFAAAVAAVAMSVAAPSPAAAQITEYAVKFVCGTLQQNFIAAPGRYYTAINIHNPGEAVGFRWKVALASTNTGGPISGFNTPTLQNDQAMEIDCRIIAMRLSASSIPVGNFYTGFLVAQTPRELDVVAVYTAQPTNGQVASIHTERVPPRRP